MERIKRTVFTQKLKTRIEKVRHYGFGFLFWKTMHALGISSNDKFIRYVEKYYLSLTPEEREEELKKWFLENVGYPLDLENPRTFDEKIQWLKLYDSTPVKTRLADKYLVRDWITEQIGEQYLIPLYGVWDSFDEIDFNLLPDRYVLKANHGSGMNIFVNDSSQLDLRKVKKEVNSWFSINFGIGPDQEWHYLHTQHKLMAEKFIGTKDEVPEDYKVYCFNGIPRYIQIIEGRFKETKQLFLDVNWEAMPFWNTNYEKMDIVPEKPKQLEQMIRLSQKLAKGFALVRVDWYLVGDEKIYFGEMTFTPASGIRHWVPGGTDEMLGDLINLPEEKYIVR